MHKGSLFSISSPTLQFSSVQSLSRVRLFATPWIAAHQASLSITNSRSLLKLMSIESVMPSSHLTLCRPLLLLPQIPPSIRVFSNESALRIGWPKYWSFSFSISPPTLTCYLLDNNHSDGCEVIPHCSFDLHSSDDSDVQHLFMCLWAIYMLSLEKMSLRVLCSFFN